MNNKKGFMLAEIIIVSVVIMVGLVSLFTLVNKVFLQYDKRIVYENVDATYVARGIAENYIKDFIKNYFSDDDLKYIVFDMDYVNGTVIETKLVNYLKKNSVVNSYIVRYNQDDIRDFVEEVYNEPETEIDDSKQVGINFYDYIINFINSNDFSDSSYVNLNSGEGEDTYDFVIFTEISDNCDDEKNCIEDNADISFGNYKFSYDIKSISTSEEGDINPPQVDKVSFANITRTIGNDHEKIGTAKISFEINDTEGEIELVNIIVYNVTDNKIFYNVTYDEKEEKKIDSCSLPTDNCLFNDFEIEGLEVGKDYYVQVYGEDTNELSGSDHCVVSNSYFCQKSDILNIDGLKGTIKNVNNYSVVSVTKDGEKIPKGGKIYLNASAGSASGYTYTFISWEVRYIDDNTLVASGTSPAYDESIIVARDFNITVTTTREKKNNNNPCLAEGTKILLADGSYKNIENVDYNDLLTVIDYQNGGITYEYPIWIENENVASSYQLITFSDGTKLKTIGEHSLFSYNDNEFIDVTDKTKFKEGIYVAKLIDNKLSKVKVEKIETINDDIKYYHVVSTRYYNIIANDLVTTAIMNNMLYEATNMYGFDKNIKWQDPILVNGYTHEEVSFIPYFIFKGLRFPDYKLYEKRGFDINVFSNYLESKLYDLWNKPKLNENGKREWMVTTSEDIVTEENKLSYLMEEGDYYTLKIPKNINGKKFIGWLHTGENIMYKPGDKVEVLYGTHFMAQYQNLFDKQIGGDYFE